MIRLFSRMGRDTRGATTVEMAFALPVLIIVMIGILQFGMILQASGAMRHGIGEGLRTAKVDATASSTTIENKIKKQLRGINQNGIKKVAFTRGTEGGADYGEARIEYTMQPVIPFAALPEIKLTESRRVWLPS